MGLNLHDAVRGIINYVHDDETVTLYQSTGQVNDRGVIRATYSEAQTVQAQIQAEGDAALFHSNNVGMNSHVVRAYLYVDDGATPAAGLDRKNLRNGDFIRRSDGSWWLVTAVIDQFAPVGWICVRAVRQTKPPEGVGATV